MASKDEIIRSLFVQLSRDADGRLQQAGKFWMNPQLGFYYGSNANSEISVDIAMRQTLLRVLMLHTSTLPPDIWPSIMKRINTGTSVASAIDTLTLASMHEIFP
jgi:hypothetical protein